MSQPTSPPDSGHAAVRSSSGAASAAHEAAGTGASNSRTAALYRAALGPVNPARYLQVFARFDAVGRPLPVWHLPAALCTLNWLVFRRLWTEAAVYVVAMAGLLTVCGGLWVLTQGWPVGVRAGLVGALLLLGGLAPGWMGYALVHRQMQRRVLQAATAATTMDEALRALRWQASSWQRLQVLVVCNALLLGVLWLGASQCCTTGLPEPLRAVWLRLSGAPDTAETTAITAPPADATATSAMATSATAVGAVESSEAAPAAQVYPVAVPPEVTVDASPLAAPAAAPADMSSTVPIALPGVAPDAVPQAPTATVAPARPSRAAPQPTARKTAATTRHGVNVGLFAQPDNARRVYERLKQAGLPATLDRIATPRGERSRVRVGPFDNSEAAQAAAQRVRALELEAVVYSLP